MPVSAAFRPDPLFMALGAEFADPVRPADFPRAELRFRNQPAAASVGLDGLDEAEWIAAFARFEALPDNQPQPLAMRYHGHQFRIYNAELGDGRGFLFAQLREAGSGRLLDLATKGSGRTPWSRGGDGRLTLKGAVREVLAAEMLQALGVPTSRAFSVIETGESLFRHDEPSPSRSAVLTRLSHSHIRIGSFQRHAYEERPDNLARLVDHAAEAYYPHLLALDGPARAAGLLAAAAQALARLTGAWTAAGFVHGVLNTDNLNITGESFDYGPYRFLPRYDLAFIAAYFDETGLYAFGRQADQVFWSLQQLAASLAPVGEQAGLVEALKGFGPAYRQALTGAFLARLGLRSRGLEDDGALVRLCLDALEAGGEALRWEPFFFDWFCGAASQARALIGPRAALYEGEAFGALRSAFEDYEAERPERLAHAYFAQAEPEELLYGAIEALWAPIAEHDDWTAFHAKVAAIRRAGEAWGLTAPTAE